jgi:hypothetical protein
MSQAGPLATRRALFALQPNCNLVQMILNKLLVEAIAEEEDIFKTMTLLMTMKLTYLRRITFKMNYDVGLREPY